VIQFDIAPSGELAAFVTYDESVLMVEIASNKGIVRIDGLISDCCFSPSSGMVCHFSFVSC